MQGGLVGSGILEDVEELFDKYSVENEGYVVKKARSLRTGFGRILSSIQLFLAPLSLVGVLVFWSDLAPVAKVPALVLSIIYHASVIGRISALNVINAAESEEAGKSNSSRFGTEFPVLVRELLNRQKTILQYVILKLASRSTEKSALRLHQCLTELEFLGSSLPAVSLDEQESLDRYLFEFQRQLRSVEEALPFSDLESEDLEFEDIEFNSKQNKKAG